MAVDGAGPESAPEAALPTIYYRIDDGGAVAREEGGWNPQIFGKNGWEDTDINFATDARVIPEAEALAETGGGSEFGEFSPTATTEGA